MTASTGLCRAVVRIMLLLRSKSSRQKCTLGVKECANRRNKYFEKLKSFFRNLLTLTCLHFLIKFILNKANDTLTVLCSKQTNNSVGC
jgi:hypothetical protein